MHSRELTTGRTFGVRFDAGESFFPALEELSRSNGIRCGYIAMFLAAFAEADIRATLSVQPKATETRAIYRQWGWRKVSYKEMDPPVPAPVFDILVLEKMPAKR